MNDETQAQQEQVTASKAKGKKAEQNANLIEAIAHEVETLSKPKALATADKLAEDIDTNSFRLGGVLKVIQDNSWYDGHETFFAFVQERFGFKERKTKYLMGIYTHLVQNQIPWEKVQHLGWTKLKNLALILTQDNVDDWVSKVEKLSYSEMMALIKADAGDGVGEKKEGTTTASNGDQTIKFKLHADQYDTVTQALSKAKGESGAEYDSVALELICTGYLGNASSLPADASVNPTEVIKALGWEATLNLIGELWPALSVDVDAKALFTDAPAAQEAGAAVA